MTVIALLRDAWRSRRASSPVARRTGRAALWRALVLGGSLWLAQSVGAAVAAEPGTRLDPLLSRLEALLTRDDEGAVLAVGIGSRIVRVAAVGKAHTAAGSPLAIDSLFDLDVLTQPVTAMAALMMQERGNWLLTDPLGRYLEEFARSDVRLIDLLRQASGMTDELAAQRRRRDPSLPAFDNSLRIAQRLSGDSFAGLLAAEPPVQRAGLITRPGFDYDLLGIALARQTKQSLGAWMLSEIFLPLELWDMGFQLDGDRRDRFVVPPRGPGVESGPWRSADDALGFDCAGACLIGTASDYLRFGQLLLGAGQLGQQRLVSAESIALMRRDSQHGRIENRIGLPGQPVEVGGSGAGYGLGVAVVGGAGLPDLPAQPGAFGLASPRGHFFWVDPSRELVVVLLAQVADPARASRIARITQAMIYSVLP